MPPTPILKAELHIAGVRVLCDKTELRFIQPTDHMGRPNAGVKLTLLEITLSGPAAFLPLWQQLQLNVFRRESGLLVWRTEQGQSVRRLTFFNAPCVALAFQLDAKGQGKQAASGLRLRFSPAAVQLDGVFVELYSRLHWEKDAAIRRRALLNPLLLPQLVPPPVAPPRLVPPGLPSLPPVAPLVGAAVGLAALLLTPANSADEPGNDAEWQFIEQQKQGLKDRSRLTYLEREQELRPLSLAEEAEYKALLTKVKGVHQAELPPTVSSDYEGEVLMEHSDLGRMALAQRKLTRNWHSGNITVFEYRDNKGVICHLVQSTKLSTGKHAERLALEKLGEEKIPAQNVTRIYSELEPCETPDGGIRTEGCKKMIENKFPTAKVTYTYKYRGRGTDTRPQRQAALDRRAEDFTKYYTNE